MSNYETNIRTNALQGYYNGIHQAREIVGKTIGGAGKNVALEIEQYPYHEVTNDGATIIEKMYFEDPVENMGLDFLKEVVGRSNKNAGDGSTTTTLLVDSILENGKEHNGLEVKRSLDACIPFIEKSIESQKRTITPEDFEQLKQVATISSEDEKLGEMLAEIYGKIGTTGIIQPEYVLGKEGNSYTFIQGVRFANLCGYLSPAMVHDEEALKENRKETRAVYERPLILVTKRKITSIKEIDPIVKLAFKKEQDLVIFTDDMDSQIAQLLIAAHQRRKAEAHAPVPRITIVKAPTVWKDYVFEDFAKCTGATIVHDQNGVNFKNLLESHLGTCEKIIIERDETILIGTKDLTEHIAELQAVVDGGNDADDDALRRISWLTAKTVLLKVGGLSETELTYKRLKCDDAVNATRSALTDGIVVGGGLALVNVSHEMPDTLGGRILKEALWAPMKQIMKNAGVESVIGLTDTRGFNAVTKEIVDMFDAGIIDSAKVALNACKNAIGIVSTVLTIDDCLILPPKEPKMEMIMPNMPML